MAEAKTLKDVITVKDVIKKLETYPENALVAWSGDDPDNKKDKFLFDTSAIIYTPRHDFNLPDGVKGYIEHLDFRNDGKYERDIVYLNYIGW